MLDKTFLSREYVELDRTAADIAREVGLSDTQVRYWIRKHGIPMKPRGGGRHALDLGGGRFGDLTVLGKTQGDGHSAVWECRCSCGNIRRVTSPHLRRGEAKSCGKCKPHYAWKGHGEISGQYWSAVRQNANKRGINFDVTIEQAWDLYLAQGRRCALSGVAIYFVRSHTFENKVQTASLDRRDSRLGYTPDNIQWTHKKPNIIKWHLSESEFFDWVKKIYEHNGLGDVSL